MTLRLLAQDSEDLKIIASAVQDAILRVGDVRFDPVGRSVTLRLSRYRHESASPSRLEAGLRFDGVMRLQSSGYDRTNKDAFAVLLDATFAETDAPAGQVTLTLAGGGALRMDVESLDVLLADTGEARGTRARPDHDIAGDA